MRFLLLIPCLMLFLTHMPFTQKVPVVVMQKAMGCNKKHAGNGMCCKKMMASAMHKCPSPVKGGCRREGADCVVIYLFEITITEQEWSPFSFNPLNITKYTTGYISPAQPDAHEAAPWQPPDMV